MEKRFCPKCRSDNVEIGTTIPGTPRVWVCNKCSFHNYEFPIRVNKQKRKSRKK